jgi:hypothetical protein
MATKITVTAKELQATKILCCNLLIRLSVVLAAVLPVWERGEHLVELLLLGILPTNLCTVHFQHLQQVVPRRARVMRVRGNRIMETSSLHANQVNGGGYSLCLVLTDGLLHAILDSSTYEDCFGKLKKYWDPGGVKLQFSMMAFLVWLIMPWDPGGSAWCRLEVKPTFKEGDCQRPLYWTATLGPGLP